METTDGQQMNLLIVPPWFRDESGPILANSVSCELSADRETSAVGASESGRYLGLIARNHVPRVHLGSSTAETRRFHPATLYNDHSCHFL